MTRSEQAERFRQDMATCLQSQDRNACFSDTNCDEEGCPRTTFDDGVRHAAVMAIQDAERDIRRGIVPASVSSFAELHNHVDANGYGGAFDWPEQPTDGDGCVLGHYSDLHLRFWNAVQSIVDRWIVAGKPDAGTDWVWVDDGFPAMC